MEKITLEGKLNESLFNIKRSLTKKTAAYSLALGLALGSVYSCGNGSDNYSGGNREKITYYQDIDGDGYGNPLVSTRDPKVGYVEDNTDCNDNNPYVHPEALELFDGTDNNCDGRVDENCLTGKIAFQSDVGDGNFEIYTINAAYGTNPNRLTTNPAIDENPAWSPDGNEIAFNSWRNGFPEIYKMDSDGANLTRLTNSTIDENPSWSPDGTKFVFVSYIDNNKEIYTIKADGTDRTRLTNNSVTDENPSWSPDSTKIAFQSDMGDGNFEIYTIKADGTDRTRLTNSPAIDENPSWSPYGILFNSWRNGFPEIYKMDSDGANLTRLTNSTIDENPSWSPDGTKFVFVSYRNGGIPKIFVANADGTYPIKLTDISAANPAWSQ